MLLFSFKKFKIIRFYSLCICSIAIISSCQRYQQKAKATYHQVDARKNAQDSVWKSYTAKTIERLPNFTYSIDPKTNNYGSWKVNKSNATGFFRVEKKEDRWWIIDPEGYPFIHKGVAVFRPGASENQKKSLQEKYDSPENWAKKSPVQSTGLVGRSRLTRPLTCLSCLIPVCRSAALSSPSKFAGAWRLIRFRGVKEVNDRLTGSVQLLPANRVNFR